MKVLIITGSRNPKGQTAKATGAVIEGLKSAGATTEEFFLATMKLERCRQCEDNGWGICRTEGKCIIEDDFQMLVDKIKDSDLVVFATPVYFSDLSESLRAFLDRLRRTCMFKAVRTPNGFKTSKQGIEGKRAIGICVAGGGGGGAPACTVSLEKVLQTCSFDLVDIIPVRRQNLDAKLDSLKSIGRDLAISK
jgi:multimeric flavodoxin WrbA